MVAVEVMPRLLQVSLGWKPRNRFHSFVPVPGRGHRSRPCWRRCRRAPFDTVGLAVNCLPGAPGWPVSGMNVQRFTNDAALAGVITVSGEYELCTRPCR